MKTPGLAQGVGKLEQPGKMTHAISSGSKICTIAIFNVCLGLYINPNPYRPLGSHRSWDRYHIHIQGPYGRIPPRRPDRRPRGRSWPSS